MPLELTTATGPEYVKVPVEAEMAGALVNPTSNAVSMCLLTEGATPAGPDWQLASWEVDGSERVPIYYARMLWTPPAPGTYVAWVKVVRDPETIVRPAGLVVVS